MPYLVMGLAQGSGVPPEFGQIDFLLSSNTTNGSTTFTDTSTNGITITPTGANVTHSTDQAKFGSTSLKFAGNSLKTNNAIWARGTGDFTLDFWIYRSGDMGTSGLGAAGLIGTTAGISVHVNSGTSIGFFIGRENGNAPGSYTISASVPLATWTHYAYVRSSGQTALATNGTFSAWAANTGNAASSEFAVGARYGDGSFPLNNAYLDEFRFSTTAVWTSNFTPPTVPYTP